MKRTLLLLTLLLSSLLTLPAQTYIYSGDKRYDYDSQVIATWDGTRLYSGDKRYDYDSRVIATWDGPRIYSGDKRYDYDSRVRYTIEGHLPVAVAIYLIL